jgi:hypothetical protein
MNPFRKAMTQDNFSRFYLFSLEKFLKIFLNSAKIALLIISKLAFLPSAKMTKLTIWIYSENLKRDYQIYYHTIRSLCFSMMNVQS